VRGVTRRVLGIPKTRCCLHPKRNGEREPGKGTFAGSMYFIWASVHFRRGPGVSSKGSSMDGARGIVNVQT